MPLKTTTDVLFKYFLSYLQSKFVLNSSINANKMNKNFELEQNDWTKIIDKYLYFFK